MDEVKDYPHYLDYPKTRKPQTNADRIRTMSDEELATFIHRTTMACNEYDCESCPIGDENCTNLDKWLRQPAEEVRT